jgi:uncharacterized membrane protein YkvA (DUF1232 family)
MEFGYWMRVETNIRDPLPVKEAFMRQRPVLPKPVLPNKKQLSALLLPIGKRTPAYLKLAWAVAREPTIPMVHRSGLIVTLIYIVTPAHLAVNAIPVLGQIDLILLLFLSLRQALKHCPEETLLKLHARVKLKPDQLQKDTQTIVRLATLGGKAFAYSVGERAPAMADAGKSVAFAGRVANGFTRRVVHRIRNAGHSA